MTLTSEIIKVGIADVKTTVYPNTLKTSGLGSCVGLVLYDNKAKIAGLAHIMLPDSTVAKKDNQNRMKYADTAFEILLHNLLTSGASKANLKAKMAGGARMFGFKSDNKMLRIGERNIEAIRVLLQHHHIPLISEDVGGNKGRTIVFDIDTSMLEIRTVNSGTKQI